MRWALNGVSPLICRAYTSLVADGRKTPGPNICLYVYLFGLEKGLKLSALSTVGRSNILFRQAKGKNGEWCKCPPSGLLFGRVKV